MRWELKELITVSDVCEKLGIRKTGNKYHCPFHTDKTPSASIKGQHFHCFSCGIHYDIFDLANAMGIDNKTLANYFGYDFKGEKSDKGKRELLSIKRQQEKQLKDLITYQENRLSSCRCWFWQQTYDEDFPAIVILDGILDRDRFPLRYDVDAMVRCLWVRWRNEVIKCN